jgi:hypothetical protein
MMQQLRSQASLAKLTALLSEDRWRSLAVKLALPEGIGRTEIL